MDRKVKCIPYTYLQGANDDMVGVLNHELIPRRHHGDFKRKPVGSGVCPEVVEIVVDAALIRLEGQTT